MELIDADADNSIAENWRASKTAGGSPGQMNSVTSIESEEGIEKPLIFKLNQNYPNPFNPKTVISYSLPVTCHIDLSVYNILGQKVTSLVSEKQDAGNYTVEWNASKFAGGIYFYRLTTETGIAFTKKLLLVK